MKTEIEAKFLSVDHDAIRAALTRLDATLEQPMRPMRRVTIDNPELKAKNAFVRVRDEGDRVTFTYKQFDALSIDGAKEIETTVGDFETAVSLLSAIGLPYRSLQESKRETWRLHNTEIVLDLWPHLDPYIEIEGDSESAIRGVAEALGLNWGSAVFGDVMVAYRAQYPHLSIHDSVAAIPEFTFDSPLPQLLSDH